MMFPAAVEAHEEEYVDFLRELSVSERWSWAAEQHQRERKFWAFLIHRAVRDYVMTKDATHVSKKRLHQETANWLFAEEPTHGNSYLHICWFYGIDAKHYRREALRTAPGHMRRMELVGRRRPRARLPR